MVRKAKLKSWRTHVVAAAMCAVSVVATAAGPMEASPARPTLRQAYEAAWARQPEAAALPARRDAVQAQFRAAQLWTPEPASVELLNKSDRVTGNTGARELDVGLVLPLWLPAERSRSIALAQVEEEAVDSRTAAAQLRTAAVVREAWWQWQRATVDTDAARGQLASAAGLQADVTRRVQAGDLARSDQHLADSAAAAATSALAQAGAALALARQQLLAATGSADWTRSPAAAVAEPASTASTNEVEANAGLKDLNDRARVADASAALASVRSRANPELTLGATRERGATGERSQNSITFGLRISFGGGARHDARVSAALADAAEAQAQWALERERLVGERATAALRLDASRLQLAAAEQRARLAGELRGFYDKSFRLGESDLPTRFRIEAEAAEAERQTARARIDVAAAISTQLQALGLLPQ